MSDTRTKCLLLLVLSIIVHANQYDISREVGSAHTNVMAFMAQDRLMCREAGLCPTTTASIVSGSKTACINGYAGEYECNNIDLLSFVSLSDLGCSDCDGNDMWGWTDTEDSSGITQLYAIAGTTTGTSFVRVTDPLNPIVVAFVPSRLTTPTIWRDIKVRNNWAYIVADRSGHQMQYFDLTRLRGINTKTTMIHDGYFTLTTGDGKCHNIVIDEQSKADIAYLVGTNGCSGGLYAINISIPNSPSFAGCFSSDGYTHDAQCITYNGPDTQYVGNEICFAYNEDTLTIVDMTNPMNGQLISRTGYIGSAYVHQGWVSTDHAFLFLDDELDEVEATGSNTGYARTYIFDIRDLSNPILKGHHDQSVKGIDHNLYVKDSYIYEANYKAGLRILQYDGNINTGDISVHEVAYFDTYPGENSVSYNGAWSSYPFFDDFIVVQDINRGLFILQATSLTLSPTTVAPTSITNNPTITPTNIPSTTPTLTPTLLPSQTPSVLPTLPPTIYPSNYPSIAPSYIPSLSPSYNPTIHPSINPTAKPTKYPSIIPTVNPTINPTKLPTTNPTNSPTIYPTTYPTSDPTSDPTLHPTYVPTTIPTIQPTIQPTNIPTVIPTHIPTNYPTTQPIYDPTHQPTVDPTKVPSNIPTTQPSVYPTNVPTGIPSIDPTINPTVFPTKNPTNLPTNQPTNQPTLKSTNQTPNLIILETDEEFVIAERNDSKSLIIVAIIIGACLCTLFTFIIVAYHGFKWQINNMKKKSDENKSNSIKSHQTRTNIENNTHNNKTSGTSPIILIAGTNHETKVLVKY